ncbi:glycosyltransferase family 92 protein [Caerostris extrusa]|uniref:Glycosyltransferase family 92 protein n=1 Tax=Caerostris extrusa TaxID=172846 RepID=A0AAV4WLB6_CAEEX|nr:glycosyltransferase family 92 protein [Caerostris extrusa]
MSDGKTMDARVVRKVMNEHWKLRYSSCFLSCEVPKNTLPPLKVLVSLNRNFTFSAMLPVHQNKENIASPRGDLAVCVKPLHYSYDRATWLLEFIEFHRILGVEHFFFYNHTVGPNVDVLLRHYISQNIVTVLPWSLPVLSQKEIRTEAIFSSLNDCVFRTMYLFHYVILLDFDEYIIPREHESYLDMLNQLEEDNKHIRGKPGSFVFKNTFFYLYWENDTIAYGVEPENHLNGYLTSSPSTKREDYRLL